MRPKEFHSDATLFLYFPECLVRCYLQMENLGKQILYGSLTLVFSCQHSDLKIIWFLICKSQIIFLPPPPITHTSPVFIAQTAYRGQGLCLVICTVPTWSAPMWFLAAACRCSCKRTSPPMPLIDIPSIRLSQLSGASDARSISLQSAEHRSTCRLQTPSRCDYMCCGH